MEMILFGYVIEIIIIWFWYKLIIKKEISLKTNGADRILRRTIKLIIQYKTTIKNNIFLRVNYKQEKRQEIERIKQYVGKLILINAWVGCFVILGPIIISMILPDKDTLFMMFVFLSVIVGFLVKQLKEQTQNYVEIVEVYIKQVLAPLEKCPRIVEIGKDELIDIQWTAKKKVAMILVVMLGIAIYALLIWGERYIEQNEIIKRILAIFTVVILLIDYVKNRFKKRENENEPVFVDIEYDLIKEEVEHICSMLNIHNVRFNVIEENTINAFSKMNEDGVWEVSVTSQFITKLRKMLEKDEADEKKVVMEIDDIKRIFLVTVGHELGHVFYKDEILIKKRLLFSLLICLGCYFTGIFLFAIAGKSTFFVIIGSILLLFDWIFGGIMCDKRYWGQIAEFKADRIAVDYASGGRKAFVNFWLTEEKVQCEDDSTQKIRRENVAYKYYKRNIEIEEHPSKKRRRKLIEERGKWEWWEYFEHVLVIRKWRWRGQGWNGVLKVTQI